MVAAATARMFYCLRELKVQYLQMLEEVAGFEALVMSSFEVALGCRLRQ